MTEQQRETLIAKMLDAPASLSDTDLELITADPETRDIYEMAVDVSNSRSPRFDIDTEKEWKLLRPRLSARAEQPLRRLMRAAAIFVGIMLFSGIALRFANEEPANIADAMVAKTEKPQTKAPSAESASPIDEPQPSASPASTKPLVANTAKKRKMVEKSTPEIDVDELLRIQQARIDNAIAIQTAQIYADECIAMLQSLELKEENFKTLEQAIRNIPLQ